MPNEATRDHLYVRSPVVRAGERIPDRFLCQEEDIWLPLEIAGVPDRAVELVLVTSRSEFQSQKARSQARLISLNLLGGLSPDLRHLEVGGSPPESFWRRHFSGLCPSDTGLSGFVFVVYAMPNRIADELKKIVYLYPPEVDELEKSALASGSLAVLYENVSSRAGKG